MNGLRTERQDDADVLHQRCSVRVVGILLLALVFSGCAAFHPLQGVPAPYVPDEYLGPGRSGKKTIDLSLLVRRQPDQYRLAAGDILSVYVPGVLGSLRVVATSAKRRPSICRKARMIRRRSAIRPPSATTARSRFRSSRRSTSMG